MTGDFGEFVAFLFLGSRAHPEDVVGPMKWRLKQDRLKPAPYSDVVQFALPDWPSSSSDADPCPAASLGKRHLDLDSAVTSTARVVPCTGDRTGFSVGSNVDPPMP